MYAISLWQPFASLIAEGIKVQETRSWSPPHRLIGQRIAIHAAKRRPTKAFLKDLPRIIHDDMYARYGYDWINVIPYGAVVCTAQLFGVAQLTGKRNPGEWGMEGVRINTGEHVQVFSDSYGDYSAGRYIWGLQYIKKKRRPVPMAGKQGLWRCDVQ